ncbi:hypothetical protein Tco_0606204, partial [Tanacetum coccineum]
MKQEGLIRHYGILQKMEDSTRYAKEGNKINIEDLLKKIKTKLMLIEDKACALRNFNLEDMELESTNSGPTAMLPILKLGDATSLESLDSIFNTLQKIVSRLAILGVIIAQEDLNLKFLSNLPPEWNTHVVVWINKPEVETMSIDDLYNNFKIVEKKVKKTVVSVASPSVNTTSPQVCTASVSDNNVYAFKVKNLNGPNVLHQDLEQIHEDDLEGIDLKWQLSLLSVEYYNCHKLGHLPGNAVHQEAMTWQKIKFSQTVALMAFLDSKGLDFKIEKFDRASKDLDQLLGSQITDKSKKGLEYSAVPPPHPLIYNRTNKIYVSYSGLDEFKEPEFKGYGPENKQVSQDKSSFVEGYGPNTSKSVSEVEPKKVRKNDGAPIIEDWVSDDEEQDESKPKSEKKSVIPTAAKKEFAKPENHEKPVKKQVRYAEMYRSQSPKGNQRNWNGQKSNQLGKDFVMYNKACYICGSFNHLQINCHNHQRRGIVYKNNYNRVDAKNTHPNVLRNMSPKAVLLKIGLTPVNTIRPVNTAHPKTTIHSAKSKTPKRHYYTGRHYAVNTVRSYSGQVNAVRVKGVNAVKSSAYWVWRPTKSNGASLAFKKHNYIDARGRSKSWMLKAHDCSKAFRVYNTRTKRVEENLHIGFLENKPMIEGTGPKWLFDIDSLTQSMNFVPVIAGTVSNDSAGTSEENSQDCIVMPIWKDTSYFDSPTKDVDNGEPKTTNDAQKQVEDGLNNENAEQERFVDDSSTKDVNAIEQQVNTASPDVCTGSLKLNAAGPSVSTASPNEKDSTEEEPEVDLG